MNDYSPTESGGVTAGGTESSSGAGFWVVSLGSCGATPFSIAIGASCTLIYRYSPTALGNSSQDFNLTHTGSGSSLFTLTGTGVADALFKDGFE